MSSNFLKNLLVGLFCAACMFVLSFGFFSYFKGTKYSNIIDDVFDISDMSIELIEDTYVDFDMDQITSDILTGRSGVDLDYADVEFNVVDSYNSDESYTTTTYAYVKPVLVPINNHVTHIDYFVSLEYNGSVIKVESKELYDYVQNKDSINIVCAFDKNTKLLHYIDLGSVTSEVTHIEK